jgi:hypothetical protein
LASSQLWTTPLRRTTVLHETAVPAMAKRAVNARQEAAKAKRNAISGKGMSGCFLCRDLDTSLISSFF